MMQDWIEVDPDSIQFEAAWTLNPEDYRDLFCGFEVDMDCIETVDRVEREELALEVILGERWGLSEPGLRRKLLCYAIKHDPHSREDDVYERWSECVSVLAHWAEEPEGRDMKYEVHCARTMDKLGEPFEQVHLWIDELAWVSGTGWSAGVQFDPEHRQYRHHLEGIEQVRQRWGEKAAQAAILHVLDDLFGAGAGDASMIPKDQKDYLAKVKGFRG